MASRRWRVFLFPSIATIRFWNKSCLWKCVGTNVVKLIPIVFPDSLDARGRDASLISIHQSWHFHFSSSLPPPHRRWLDLILRVTSLFPSWKRIFLTLSCDFPLPATATALVTSVLDVRSFPAAENSHITKKHRDIKSPRKYYKGLCLKHLLIYLLDSRLYRHLPLHLPARRSRRLQISSWEKQWWEKRRSSRLNT